MEHPNDIDDRLSRAVGIPGFGLTIPHLTGLFGGLPWTDPRTWAGSLWFVALAAAVWEGNRWLLFRQRERLDWFTRPVPKVVFLVVGCVFYTAPVTALAIAGWYAAAGLPVDTDALAMVVLTNVICVLVVTHLYETAFLIKARRDDRVRLERLQRTRAEAELAALRAQLDPHFLFNSLGTLAWLIDTGHAGAAEHARQLASVYRYLLATRERDLVQLADELAFLEAYRALLAVRFGDALKVEQELGGADPDRVLLPPIALQVLLENAVKHNAFSAREPLRVRVVLRDDTVEVANDARPRRRPAPGEGVGLTNLAERCRLLLGRGLDVRRADGRFVVGVPVVHA